MAANDIVRCAIYPGIGIARVGNSTSDYFVGPEVPGLTPSPGGAGYKDAQGRIKRQAARFRLYGLNAAGAVFEVLTDEQVVEESARALAEGKALGWFQGRMEFGPRALGARSILGDARSPSMQKQLNLKVKYRESFRPFAPAVLAARGTLAVLLTIAQVL